MEDKSYLHNFTAKHVRYQQKLKTKKGRVQVEDESQLTVLQDNQI